MNPPNYEGGFKVGGNLIAGQVINNFNTTVPDGNHAAHQNSSTRSSANANPMDQDLEELGRRVEVKLQAIQLTGVNNPQEEFFRGNLTTFYNETSSPDQLAHKLYDAKVISDYQKEEIKNERLRYDKNYLIYGIVIRKRAILKLLPALAESGNENILDLIREQTN